MSKKTASKSLRPLFDSLDRRDVPSSMATGIVAPSPVGVTGTPLQGSITVAQIRIAASSSAGTTTTH